MALFRNLLVASALLLGLATANAADTQTAPAADQAAPATDASATTPATNLHSAAKAGHKAAAKIDINTASAATLAKVKGIGPKKAKAIISYREQNKITSLDQLRNITNAKGKSIFSEKSIKALENRLSVG